MYKLSSRKDIRNKTEHIKLSFTSSLQLLKDVILAPELTNFAKAYDVLTEGIESKFYVKVIKVTLTKQQHPSISCTVYVAKFSFCCILVYLFTADLGDFSY